RVRGSRFRFVRHVAALLGACERGLDTLPPAAALLRNGSCVTCHLLKSAWPGYNTTVQPNQQNTETLPQGTVARPRFGWTPKGAGFLLRGLPRKERLGVDLSDPNTILEVWKRGTEVKGVDAAVWRKDECGAWMRFDHRGDRNSEFGWEIDHMDPNGP